MTKMVKDGHDLKETESLIGCHHRNAFPRETQINLYRFCTEHDIKTKKDSARAQLREKNEFLQPIY